MRYPVKPALLLLFSLITGISHGQVTRDSLFNAMFRSESGGWVAGDATYSVALPDGRILWLFGDSFIGTALPDSSIASGSHMIRNCAILQTGDSLQSLYNGTFENPGDFIPSPDPDSSWLWPEHGLVENDTLKLFLSEFKTTQGVPGWNFAFHNTWLAWLSYPGLQLLGMEVLPYHDINEVMYGNQVLSSGGYTYIYGRRDGPNNVANAHVARVPAGNISAPWEFYNGNAWSPDPAATAWITFQAVSQQYAVTSHQDKFILLTQQIWLGTEIYTMTADSPEGPWVNKTTIYTTPLPFATQFTYNAWSHPEHDLNNELLVSYNSNGDFWSIFGNVELYRPTFLRVPYELIDPGFLSYGEDPPAGNEQPTVRLLQNHPNPVSCTTTFVIGVNHRQRVSLELYDARGQQVALLAGQEFPPGVYEIPADLSTFAPGVYSYRAGNQVRKLILLP